MVAAEALGIVLGYLGIIVGLGWLAKKLIRTTLAPRELRGDWWTPFERDFHAYASRHVQSDRIRDRDI